MHDLINDDLEEINTEMIDEISDSINEKYIELFYVASEKEMEKGVSDE